MKKLSTISYKLSAGSVISLLLLSAITYLPSAAAQTTASASAEAMADRSEQTATAPLCEASHG